MGYLVDIAGTGLVAVLRTPLRSLVTIGCLLVFLVPFLTGLAISKGVQREAEMSIRFGADLYVTGTMLGRNVPIPVTLAKQVERIDGVREVVPRIIGGIVLGKNSESAVLVGVPRDRFPSSIRCVDGDLPTGSSMNELVIGTELARQLGLNLGTLLPPFYRSSKGERVSKVVGVFKSEVSIWQARLIFTSLDTAASIFDQPGLVTDFLVYCETGREAAVRSCIRDLQPTIGASRDSSIRLECTAREDLASLLPTGLLHREGIFNLHFVLAFAVSIAVVLLTSGFGLSERRREIGILKATGWQTDEILFRSMVESVLLSVTATSLAIVFAHGWLAWFNGYWIASVFFAGVNAAPSFKVPFQLAPVPALVCLLVSFLIVTTGTVYTSWRAAVVAPREAIG
jgi:ABC-type lipoprotein release transport system permease subunit